MAKTSDAQLRATAKYQAENIIRLQLKFNRRTDADILSRLDREGNITGYIKALIRADIEKDS